MKSTNHRTPQKPLLVLPIEIYEREIDGRLWLAGEALQRGYQVLIAHHGAAFLSNLSDCGILYKDHGPGLSKLCEYHGWKDPSLWIGALDEEGLVFRDKNTYRKTRVDGKALQYINDVFFVGDTQKNAAGIECFAAHTHISGHPRFDLCHVKHCQSSPEEPSGKLHVLINTRFGSLFPLGEQTSTTLRHHLTNNPSLRKTVANELVIFREFMALVDLLSSDPKIKITLRPHPAERPDYYRKRFQHTDNVSVQRSFGVIHAIQHADVVVHDGCTTAIEACLMGKVVIGQRPPLPYTSMGYTDFCNQFSLPTTSAQETYNLITSLRSRQSYHAISNRMQALREAMWPSHHIANWNSIGAAMKILDVVDQQKLPPRPAPVLSLWHRWKIARETLRRHVLKGCSTCPPITSIVKKLGPALQQIQLTDSKFPVVTVDDIVRRTEYILGERFTVQNIGNNCFLMCSS
ncbi:MAG: hypothetical protein EA401_10860 [Planctomycetota bacterium]|nr:MAG: hypothetical protein EA401_10860 [Planctomycetota bacterium]